MYPIGDLHLAAGVLLGLVHHQQHALLLPGSHLLGEFPQGHREQLDVYRGQDQPEDLPALGPHEAVEVGPFIAPLFTQAMGLLPTGAHTRLTTGFKPNRASSSAQSSTCSASGWASLSFSSFPGRLF